MIILYIIINCSVNILTENYCGKRNYNLGTRNKSNKLYTLASLDWTAKNNNTGYLLNINFFNIFLSLSYLFLVS